MRVAVVDLGSNTTRMVVYDVTEGQVKKIMNEKAVLGLVGYYQNGNLSEEGIRKVTSTIITFHETACSISVNEFHCFATAGLRNAKNSAEVVDQILRETGIAIEVISGEYEAHLDFVGFRETTTVKTGFIVDMGGASTEIVSFQDLQVTNSVSLSFGSLWLYYNFVHIILPTKEEKDEIKKYIKKQIESVEWIKGENETICGIGGTVRAIAKLHRDIYQRKDPIEGYTFEAKDLKDMIRYIDKQGVDGFKRMMRVIPERIHTVLPGMIALQTLVKFSGCKTFTVSRYGAREGYLKERILNSSSPEDSNTIQGWINNDPLFY